MKIRLKIPTPSEPLKQALRSKKQTVLIHTTPHKGARDCMIAWIVGAAGDCSTPLQAFVWVSDQPDAARRDVLAMINKIKPLAKSLHEDKDGVDVVGPSNAMLYFCTRKQFEQLPFKQAKAVVMENVHLLPDDPEMTLAQLVPAHGYVRMFGQTPEIDHWWGNLLKRVQDNKPDDVEFIRVTLNDEIKAGRVTLEQATHLKKKLGDDRFKREFLLEAGNAAAKWQGSTFEVFAKQRLKITTDRELALLTPAQQEAADVENWPQGPWLVPFEVSSLQRVYQAKKDAAISAGRRPRFLLLKYRQGGFTTYEQGKNYETIATRPRSQVLTLAHTDESTARIFNIARTMYQNDPYQPVAARAGNKTEITLVENNSTFFIGSAGKKSFGRGFTLQRVHGSEVAFWGAGADRVAKVQSIMSGLGPATRHGEIVLESTPNGIEWFALTYKAAKEGKNDWTPIFLRWFDDPLNRMRRTEYNEQEIRDTLTEEEKVMMAIHGIDLAQVAFRRAMQRENGVLFPQEYPEDDDSCFLTTGTPYFDLEVIRKHITAWERKWKGHEPKIREGVIEEVWEEPEEGVEYVIGADTSEGLPKSDPNGLGVMRKDNGKQVASVHGQMRIKTQAKKIDEYHRKYNKAIIGVERNNHGHAVIELLEEKYGHKGLDHRGYLYNFANGRNGWDTNSSTRPIMLNELALALEERTGWRDRAFLSECMTFKLQDDGTFAADPGATDDRVIKWAIANQMRKFRRRKANIEIVDLNDYSWPMDDTPTKEE